MAKQGEASLLLKIKEMGAEAIDKVQESIGALKVFAVASFAAISAVVYKSIDAYKEQEEATNQLSQAMANAGVFSNELRQKYLDQAQALQKITTFADEQIVSAQATLQAFTNGREVTEELTKATLNLAAAKKMDLNSAAELIGKTIGSSTNALARQGIEFDNNTTGAARLAAVTDALNQKFHGQAEAAASGLGSLKQLQNAAGDVFEVLGERLAPAVTVVARELTKLAEQFQKNEAIFDGFVSVVQFGLKLVNGLGSAFHDLSSAVGGYIGIVAGAGEAALKGQFGRAKMIVQQGLADIQAMGEENERAMLERQAAIDNISTTQKQEKNAKDAELLTQSLDNQREIKLTKKQEEDLALLEADIAAKEMEAATAAATDEQKIQAQISMLDKQLKNAEGYAQKKRLMELKYAMTEQLEDERNYQKKKTEDERRDQEQLSNRASTLSRLATMQRSGNQTMAAIGKAAALTQIAIDTPAAVMKALNSGIPYPLNLVAAASIAAMGAMQAAQVAGVQLADGGIVRATQGGVPAIIGEGGRDEAVIPLENGGVPGIGNSIVINVNGGLMGDMASAREFAIAIDRELLNLRRQNQSVSFDGIS